VLFLGGGQKKGKKKRTCSLNQTSKGLLIGGRKVSGKAIEEKDYGGEAGNFIIERLLFRGGNRSAQKEEEAVVS